MKSPALSAIDKQHQLLRGAPLRKHLLHAPSPPAADFGLHMPAWQNLSQRGAKAGSTAAPDSVMASPAAFNVWPDTLTRSLLMHEARPVGCGSPFTRRQSSCFFRVRQSSDTNLGLRSVLELALLIYRQLFGVHTGELFLATQKLQPHLHDMQNTISPSSHPATSETWADQHDQSSLSSDKLVIGENKSWLIMIAISAVSRWNINQCCNPSFCIL